MALYGYDISKWQRVGAGDSAKDFVICKATEGVGYVDPNCDKHYQRAKGQGKLLGVYHFARPDKNSAEAEAEFFVKNIQGYIKEAILILDWEQAGQTGKTGWAKAWLDKVYALTGVRPLIYTSASVVNGNNWSAISNDYGLWIAGYPNKYNVKNPPTPTTADMPYKTGSWKFWAIWQYSSCAGNLDLDIANMDKQGWLKYAQATAAPKPTPAPAPAPAKKSVDEIANEVIAGKWGNGEDRVKRLTQAGYNAQEVQNVVNKKLGAGKKKETVIYYSVRRGDNLSSIAAKYGTTVDKIARDNGIKNKNLIYAGQRLVIKK